MNSVKVQIFHHLNSFSVLNSDKVAIFQRSIFFSQTYKCFTYFNTNYLIYFHAGVLLLPVDFDQLGFLFFKVLFYINRKKSNSPTNAQESQPSKVVISESQDTPKQHVPHSNSSQHPAPTSGKEAWPSLAVGNKAEHMTSSTNRSSQNSASHTNRSNSPHNQNRTVGNGRKKNTQESETQ